MKIFLALVAISLCNNFNPAFLPTHEKQNPLSEGKSVEFFSEAQNSFVAQMQPYDSTGNSLHGPLRGREGTWKKNLVIKMATL